MAIKSKISLVLSEIPILRNILGAYKRYNFRRIANRDPRINANKVYKSVFHNDINWNNPGNLIEKIYWLQIYTDTSCGQSVQINLE